MNKINIVLKCKMISLPKKKVYSSISKFGTLKMLKNKFTYNNNFNDK